VTSILAGFLVRNPSKSRRDDYSDAQKYHSQIGNPGPEEPILQRVICIAAARSSRAAGSTERALQRCAAVRASGSGPECQVSRVGIERTTRILRVPSARAKRPTNRAFCNERPLDVVPEASQFADHLACAYFLGLGANGGTTFLIADLLVENLPDQTAQSVSDRADRPWPRRGTSRRYTTWKIVPLALTAALAAWLRTRRIWRLPFGQRWL
jgi:hypothetical protein